MKQNLIIGGKYVPIKKSMYGNLDGSTAWTNAKSRKQSFLYLTLICEKHLVLNETMEPTGDYFLEEDIIPYEEFPEKWCILRTPENAKILNNWAEKTISAGFFKKEGWFYSGMRDWANHKPKDYTEITFEQFKEHILKQTNMKEIIGYTLNKEEYRKAALAIVPYSAYLQKTVNLKFICKTSTSVEKLKEAGVLDLWFEPVYEEDKVEILGYTAEKIPGGVKLGCQSFDKNTLEVIKELLSRNGVNYEITVQKAPISLQQINNLLNLIE